MRAIGRLTAALACAAAILCAAAPSALAGLEVDEFDVTFTDAEGRTVNRAGSHPYEMTTRFHFVTEATGKGGERLEEQPRDFLVEQIAGFVGDPYAVPRCSAADFLRGVSVAGLQVADCPDSAAVGTIAVNLAALEGSNFLHGAVYNLRPAPGAAAKLGFWISGVPITLELGVRESPPYNVSGGPTAISRILEVVGSELVIWGDPADSSHDPVRGHCLHPGLGTSLGECAAPIPERAFITLPRSCEGPLTTAYRAASWQHPADFVAGAATTHDEFGAPQGMSGCGALSFSPRLALSPTTSQAESASGLRISIDVEDAGLRSPEGVAQADIAALEFALPEGMTADPSAAEGLGTCSEAQYLAARLQVRGCPEDSKLGTIEAETPILEGHLLRGSVHLAAQYANPFGSLLAAYILIRDPELGVFARVASEIETDPETGRLIARAEDLPPFPLSRVRIDLRSGPRAPFITPPACGTHTSEATLHPSSGGEPVEIESSFELDSGPGGGPCPPAGAPPFAPGFEAGSTNNAAGAFSPFSLRIARNDGEQDITRFSAILPPGVLGSVAGIPRCPDAAIAAAGAKSGRAELAAPSCPAASRLGRVLAGAGVGSALTYVGGSLYLAGPYNGAPLSVAAIVPAVAGPFDVGTVVTRVALDLNPNTGEVEVDGAASDPIPHILEGIPLKLRDLRVITDRPGFTLNPTSCSESSTRARIGGGGPSFLTPADDTFFDASSRYQAASCASLGFKPNLTIAFRGQTKRTGHPSLRAELVPRAGDANVRSAVTFLPKTTFVDAANVPGVCTREEFAREACPKESILGKARAFTPLLDEPLEGNVYFRSNGDERELPDIVADLKGQFRIVLVGYVDSRRERIRTRFLNVPDAPVSKFVLRLYGGNRGLVQNSADLCRHRGRGILNLAAKNGRVKRSKPKIAVRCNKRKGRRVNTHARAR